jgi:hypothetical protein
MPNARKPKPRPHGPDFTSIDSLAKAVEMFERGELEKLFLMPLEFGGSDIPANTLYVPIGIAEVKASCDRIIGELANKGRITKYTATPEYQGKSAIPIAIEIVASDPGEFTSTINIWGEALGRDE